MKKSYKTRGQGFTLIELLAVLVVLAILALIAIPIVIKVINNAREDSYKRSIEGYARTVEIGLARWSMANPGVEFPTKLDEIVDEEGKTLIDIKGDQVKCENEIKVTDKGEVNLYGCYTEKSGDKKKWDYIDGQIKDATSKTYEEYNVGDSFTFGGAGYHVIAESGIDQDYVVALKDEPLTVDEVTSLGYTPSYTYTGGTKQWAGMSYDNTDPKSSDYDTSDVKPLVDAWANQYSNKLSEVNGYKARLLIFQEINTLSEEKVYSDPTVGDYTYRAVIYDWVYNTEYSYWTMTPYYDFDAQVWNVEKNGRVSSHYLIVIENNKVIRPVINVLKSYISKN